MARSRRLPAGWPSWPASLPALGQDRTHVELFNKQSRHDGHVILDPGGGRIDTYDRESRRTGYGVMRPDGRVELYHPDGTRAASSP